jgi:TolB-like protein
MSSTPDSPPPSSGPRAPTVFLSYASEDRPAAQVLREALPSHGVEVWYDETELTGGDAWDQKIRQQIRECDFFIAVISAQTEARHEGYFRREWRLAVERSLDMADDHLFLLPVVIDDTPQADARVPEKFLAVHWTRVPGGQPNPAFEALCRRILQGDVRPASRAGAGRTHPPTGTNSPVPLPEAAPEPDAVLTAETVIASARARRGRASRPPPPPLPPFPREEPDQKSRFIAEVAVWGVHSGWLLFQRLPLGWRILAGMWLAISLLSTCSHHSGVQLSTDEVRKLKAIESTYQSAGPVDAARLASEIHSAVSDEGDSKPAAGGGATLLAIPFSAPGGDADARKFANATFAQIYGQLAMSHHGQVGLLENPPAALDDKAAIAQAKGRHASYVLLGTISGTGESASLTVRMLEVESGEEAWSKAYTSRETDPAAIATEVDQRVQAHEDD